MSNLEGKTIYVLGADGYLGWPLSLRLHEMGVTVIRMDSFIKRSWEKLVGASPLLPLPERRLFIRALDLVEDAGNLYNWFDHCPPDAVVHLAEQPSAPFSMLDRRKAIETQRNNVLGTLNLAYAVAHAASKHGTPPAHIVKLGSMGEYGTPNIPIEEGWLDIEHKGFKDRMLYPKKPGSLYHCSKVHDSHNLEFLCRAWGFRVTDLNQGVVWGLGTKEAVFEDDGMRTSFHIDEIFGTVLNRFVCQGALGSPLSVYGNGGQTRGFIHIEDSLRCMITALENPAAEGEFRVANQLTEIASVKDLASRVSNITGTPINYVHNPRVEAAVHPYRVTHEVLPALGFKASQLLTDDAIADMLDRVSARAELQTRRDELEATPKVLWRQK